MKTLAHAEARFQDYVLGRDDGAEADVAGDDAAFRSIRLGIYRDAYRLRLAEVLGSDYEVLKEYTGGSAFGNIATDYLAAHPSSFRNVRWFGGQLAVFLRTDPRHAGRPVLADLAEFEWALGLAFDAPDSTPVAFGDLARIPAETWPDLRLRPHPAWRMLVLESDAVAIWNAIKAGQAVRTADESARPRHWAIWRRGDLPYFRSLEADEAGALASMADGASFGEICAGLCEWVAADQAAPRAASLLRGWVDEGWIGELVLPR